MTRLAPDRPDPDSVGGDPAQPGEIGPAEAWRRRSRLALAGTAGGLWGAWMATAGFTFAAAAIAVLLAVLFRLACPLIDRLRR